MRSSLRGLARASTFLAIAVAVAVLAPIASAQSPATSSNLFTGLTLTFEIKTPVLHSVNDYCNLSGQCITNITVSTGDGYLRGGEYDSSGVSQNISGELGFFANPSGFRLSTANIGSPKGTDDVVTWTAKWPVDLTVPITGQATFPKNATVTVQATLGDKSGPVVPITGSPWSAPLSSGVSLKPPTRAKITATPGRVPAGGRVKVFGNVAGGCVRGDAVTLLSRAFSRQYSFAGLPAVYANVGRGGNFSVRTQIPAQRTSGRYSITGRCGGGNLGVTTSLRVLANRQPAPNGGLG